MIFEGLGLAALGADSRLLWAQDVAAHHDLDVADDGRIYVLTRRARFDESVSTELPVLEDFVTVLDPDGEVERSISLRECVAGSPWQELFDRRQARFLEHLGPPVEGTAGGNPWGDLHHTNTLQLLEGIADDPWRLGGADRVMLSMRNVDIVAVADLSSGRLVWASAGSWRRQHQPTLLPSGHVLLFDNSGTPRRSRVLEFDPGTGESVWSYQADRPDEFFSAASGSCQRLPGGNTLVVESNAGRAFELTPAKEIVWEFRSPHRAGDDGELVANLFDLVRLPVDAAPRRER